MTRFVYVLPAGRLRWEVRVEYSDLKSLMRELADLFEHDPRFAGGMGNLWYADMIRARLDAPASDPVSIYYRRKAHALIAARAIAIIIGGEVQPHNRWGRIQDPDSFGPDSPKRKG